VDGGFQEISDDIKFPEILPAYTLYPTQFDPTENRVSVGYVAIRPQ